MHYLNFSLTSLVVNAIDKLFDVPDEEFRKRGFDPRPVWRALIILAFMAGFILGLARTATAQTSCGWTNESHVDHVSTSVAFLSFSDTLTVITPPPCGSGTILVMYSSMDSLVLNGDTIPPGLGDTVILNTDSFSLGFSVTCLGPCDVEIDHKGLLCCAPFDINLYDTTVTTGDIIEPVDRDVTLFTIDGKRVYSGKVQSGYPPYCSGYYIKRFDDGTFSIIRIIR